jgi:hypothetical protein
MQAPARVGRVHFNPPIHTRWRIKGNPRARIHKTLRVTPAMAANVTKRLWEMSDIVDVLEAWEAAN